MDDLLDERLRQFYPEYPHFVKSRRIWFGNNALKVFTEKLGLGCNQSEEICSIVLDTLEWSNRKIRAVKKAISEILPEETSEEFVKALIPVVIGSVARFEAEAGSDIDPDFIVDTTLVKKFEAERRIKDLAKAINTKLKEMSPKKGVVFRLREIKDIKVYSMEEMKRIDHLTNLLIGCYVLENKESFGAAISEAKSETTKKELVRELTKRISDELSGRKKENKPVKVGYTIVTYVVRILALNYLECDDLNKSYWRICELLHGKVDEHLWRDLAMVIRSLIFARRRADRKEEIRKYVEKKIMFTANSIYLQLC